MAPSPEEKNNWFQELQSKIFAQKRLFNDVSAVVNLTGTKSISDVVVILYI